MKNGSLSKTLAKGVEDIRGSHRHLLCWRSVLAGVLISTMSFMILSAFGSGVSGTLAARAIANDEIGANLAAMAGFWIGLSVVISLFMGAYFSLRISSFVTNKVGAAHSFVVATVFFLLLIVVAGSGFGQISRGTGRLAQGLGIGGSGLMGDLGVQDALYKALGKNALRSDPKEVLQGLATRLMQGDVVSAKAFLSYQTGLGTAEADARITQAMAGFNAAAVKAAVAFADMSWSLFATFIFGQIAALFGGRVGAHANADRPLAAERRQETFSTSGVAIPV